MTPANPFVMGIITLEEFTIRQKRNGGTNLFFKLPGLIWS
jgi:hypothetical protein